MAILAGDIDYHLSGGAANEDVDAALGGVISSVELVGATLQNLFDIVGSDESAAGDVEHRCIYVKNAHETLTLQNAKVWIQTQTPSDDTDIQIALAEEGVNGTAEVIGDETPPPSGENFSAPANEGEALTIGDIPPGEHQAIWVKRNIGVAAAAYNNDSVVLRVKGDTAE